jgi:hypothetical protein
MNCTRCGKEVEDEHYKRCTKCRDHLASYYDKRGRCLRGYTSAKRYRKMRRDSIGLLELECTKCNEYKTEDNFRKSICHRHGRHTICNTCNSKSTPSYDIRVLRAMHNKGISEREARYFCSRGHRKANPKKTKYKIHPWKEKNELSFWKKVA